MRRYLIKFIRKSFELFEFPIFLLMRLTLHFPVISNYFNKKLRRHMVIHQSLRDIAYKYDLFNELHNNNTTLNTATPTHLTLHAHQIYSELEPAIKAQQEKNI